MYVTASSFKVETKWNRLLFPRYRDLRFPQRQVFYRKRMTRLEQDHDCCVGQVAGIATRWGRKHWRSLQAEDQQEEKRRPTERQ